MPKKRFLKLVNLKLHQSGVEASPFMLFSVKTTRGRQNSKTPRARVPLVKVSLYLQAVYLCAVAALQTNLGPQCEETTVSTPCGSEGATLQRSEVRGDIKNRGSEKVEQYDL